MKSFVYFRVWKGRFPGRNHDNITGVTVTVVKLYKGGAEYLGLDVVDFIISDLAVNEQFQPQTHPDLFFFQILLYLISLVALSGFHHLTQSAQLFPIPSLIHYHSLTVIKQAANPGNLLVFFPSISVCQLKCFLIP